MDVYNTPLVQFVKGHEQMRMTIERDAAAAAADFGRTRYPWDKIKPGMSLVVESGKDDYRKAQRAAYVHAKKHGWRIRIAWDRASRQGKITRLS